MSKTNLHFLRNEKKPSNSRRRFLAYSGATITASGLFLIGCSDDDGPVPDDTLAAPSNLAADNATEGEITLSWTDNSDDEDGFSIERSTSMDSGFAEVGTVAAGVTTYTDTELDPGTQYYYRVSATRGTDVSAYSSVINSTTSSVVAVFGSGDVGILNYAYALEQLEAAFYTAVIAGAYYDGAAAEEKQILADLQMHEVNHREFFRAAIPAEAIIPDLAVNFDAIDFDDRASVLGTAKIFEDLGVSAYNGAGQFLESADYLLIAGKIVSVEARHASAIRDLLNPNSADFAGDDIINASGLEITRSFADVLAAAGGFITTEIDASGLPTESGFQVTV
ncbi:MAG: ferritin-like domain-containing protein [Cyclobacteriaceae bacterium]